MQYNLKGTNVPITDELRTYVEKCLTHPEKFLAGDSAAFADVEVEHAPSHEAGKWRAEFTIASSSATYRATARGETLHSALDIAIDELVTEVRRQKEKRQNVFRRSALKVKEFVRGWRGKI